MEFQGNEYVKSKKTLAWVNDLNAIRGKLTDEECLILDGWHREGYDGKVDLIRLWLERMAGIVPSEYDPKKDRQFTMTRLNTPVPDELF